jgi:hypothetical protein
VLGGHGERSRDDGQLGVVRVTDRHPVIDPRLLLSLGGLGLSPRS